MRTPSKQQPGGSSHAVLVRTRDDRSLHQVVDHDDARAGLEADVKSDQQGLGLATRRQRKLVAQQMVVLLTGLAHHVRLWARRWLAKEVPRWGGWAACAWCTRGGPPPGG